MKSAISARRCATGAFILPSLLLLLSGDRAIAQEGGSVNPFHERSPDSETSRSGPPAASANMPVTGPSDTEVMQPDRSVLNQQTTPTFPLEEPLNPDKYICGRGDTFELNFWGRQNFKLRVAVDLEGRTFIPRIGYVAISG